MAVNLKHFASVKIAQAFLSANAMVVLSHFKGHAMGGFGGAIKNLAMGCAPQAGKIDQHGRNVVIYPKCIGCGQCADRCPLNNITIRAGRPVWGNECTHCMACICYCPTKAIEYGKKSVGKPRYHFEQLGSR